jgi:hypothetical protein
LNLIYFARYKKYSKDGTKYYYVCSKSKSCERNCFIFEVKTSSNLDKYELFLCTSSRHEHIIKDCKRLPPATKEYIEQLYKLNISNPNQIYFIIQREKLPPMSKFQINSLLQRLKNQPK